MQETWVWSLGQEDPLKKGMATHSSILAWRIPWTEEPGGLQSVGSQRVGHDWATNTFTTLHKVTGIDAMNPEINKIHIFSNKQDTYILKCIRQATFWTQSWNFIKGCLCCFCLFCFPGTSADKDTACNAWEPGSIPGPGRSSGEGIGYPLQYSWAPLVAQLQWRRPGFNPWVGKIPWRRERLPTPVFWPGESHGLEKSQIQLSNFYFHMLLLVCWRSNYSLS